MIVPEPFALPPIRAGTGLRFAKSGRVLFAKAGRAFFTKPGRVLSAKPGTTQAAKPGRPSRGKPDGSRSDPDRQSEPGDQKNESGRVDVLHQRRQQGIVRYGPAAHDFSPLEYNGSRREAQAKRRLTEQHQQGEVLPAIA